MSLLDRIFAEPELIAAPPVLVDVGAAAGIHPAWRRIVKYSIGVGFEPDVREVAALGAAQRAFKRWIFCPVIAVPAPLRGDRATLHLTSSPQCSSVLLPRNEVLREWAFSDFFTVTGTTTVAATTLAAALTQQGLAGIDWLKCDTQGLDLKLFLSLPQPWRDQLLAVEFEPGLIDAYEGEDKVGDVLTAMATEPFWLAEMTIGRTARGRKEEIAAHAGDVTAKWLRQFGPAAPGWANLHFLRNVTGGSTPGDRRALLLAWVFASLAGQPAHALTVALKGREIFGAAPFTEMISQSGSSLRWAMLGNVPGAIWRRFKRG